MFALDTLQNLVSGLFTSKDKTVANQWVFSPLDRAQMEAAYRSGGLARKIVDIPPFDMTRAWRDWQADDDQIELIEAEETRLGVRQKVAKALRLARLYGGSAIVLGFGDTKPETPAPTPAAGGLQFLTVLMDQEISVAEFEQDPLSPYYGEPKYYTVASANGVSAKLHPSRVLRFIGAERPNWRTAPDAWGDSVLQVINDALQNAELAAQSTAAMVPEAKVDVIRVPALMENLSSAEYRDRLTTRFALANTMKSINNTLLLDKEEEWDRKEMNFSQLPQVMTTFLGILAGVADIPATRLLGRSPDGQNSTGESDVRNYYDRISAEQNNWLRPILSRLDEPLIWSALGSRPKEIHYQWAPLWQMTEVEKAEVAKKKAETTQIYANTALVPADALARVTVNQLIEDGTYPGLEAAIDDAEQTPEEFAIGEKEAAAIEEKARLEAQAQQTAPVTDATPRPLYVRRDVVNKSEIAAWAKGQGITDLADDLHVTIAYSRQPLDWIKAGNASEWGADRNGGLTIPAGGPRVVEALGGMTAVLMFASSQLCWRHEEIIRAGASYDYEDYLPHISLTKAPIDLATVAPYRGPIVLGPEIFEDLDLERA